MSIPVGTTVYCYAQTCTVVGYDEPTDTYALMSILRLPPYSASKMPVAGFVAMPHYYPAVPVDDLLKWAPA
ncbi:MAG: hypothetical protein AAAB35_24865 [Phyllobacterium sp.]|uniref:hypothetical protein n=1 Tax=Phyllobacterium sp. TaxID=1871046 RepID=UPI0030F30ABF